MSQRKRIVVIGGGVVGLCVAYFAMQKGHSVVVVERGGPDRDCCSLGNAGMIVPSHFAPLAAPGMLSFGLRAMWNPESPFYVRPRLSWELVDWGWRFWRTATGRHVTRSGPLLRDLHLASRGCFEEFVGRIEDFGLEKHGILMMCRTPRCLHEEAKIAQRAEQLGIPAHVLSAAETGRLNPGLHLDIAGAVHYPQDCHLNPQKFVAALTRRLEQDGVTFAWSRQVTGWQLQRRQITAVHTSRGEIAGDEFVLSAGSWSATLLQGLNLHMPLQAGKGYSVTLPQPIQQPAMGCILVEARVAVTPMGKALRIGGTMELTGLDETINPVRVEGIIKSVPHYFPDFRPEQMRGLPIWCGLRPCSPDGLPYVGRFERYKNLSAAAGHAMMGLSLAPITGRLMAELLSGERPSIDLGMLRPDRFQ